MSNDLLTYLAKKLDEDIKAIENDLPMGTAGDYATYRFICGVYRGLLMAKNHIVETAERMNADDDAE